MIHSEVIRVLQNCFGDTKIIIGNRLCNTIFQKKRYGQFWKRLRVLWLEYPLTKVYTFFKINDKKWKVHGMQVAKKYKFWNVVNIGKLHDASSKKRNFDH